MFEAFILSEVVFLSKIFQGKNVKFFWDLNKIDLILSVSS